MAKNGLEVTGLVALISGEAGLLFADAKRNQFAMHLGVADTTCTAIVCVGVKAQISQGVAMLVITS